jgi:hypothetical protein
MEKPTTEKTNNIKGIIAKGRFFILSNNLEHNTVMTLLSIKISKVPPIMSIKKIIWDMDGLMSVLKNSNGIIIGLTDVSATI